MFEFLKKKLKGALSRFSKKAEEEAEEEVFEKPVEEIKKAEEKDIKELEEKEERLEEKEEKLEEKEEKLEKQEEKLEKKEKKAKKAEKKEIKKEEKEVEKEIKKVEKEERKVERDIKEVEEEEKEVEEKIKEEQIKVEEIEKKEEKAQDEKKGFFKKLTEKVITKRISEEQFEDLFWTLEVVLMENNVAVEVIAKIKDDLKTTLVNQPIRRGKIEETIAETLKKSLEELFSVESLDLAKKAKENKEKPLVICFVGVNGSGKTTTIAKVAHYLKKNGLTCVLAASDTFRAAAIDQLQLHADKLDVKLIKHDYGSDAAAVAFDAIKHAKAKKIDAVLIDTAGRMHANVNLMDEMKKIVRVAKPDLNIFVGETITGNDCVEQAKTFNEAVGIHGIILTKADVDEKGGAAVSISHVTKKPILFLGTGQEYDDLKEFNPDLILANVGL
jgi:fused signal recognition particle receptor